MHWLPGNSFHQIVLLERAHALEHDLAVHDDVAAVGDADRLVEVLLGHEHRGPLRSFSS